MDKVLYLLICSCFLISVFMRPVCLNKRDVNLLNIALFFTAIADFFLIIRLNPEIGVFFFIVVQFFYYLRYRDTHKLWLVILIFFNIFIISLIVSKNLLNSLAITYIAMFLMNIFNVITFYKTETVNKKIVLIAMSLFLMCDVNVGLYFLFKNIINFYLIWVFYLPSQFLLAISSKNFNYKNS